jgi:DNA-binding transcriptional LysR family regulator
VVLREFQRHKVPLNMDVEMPTLETIRRLVQNDEGVAFLPRMCVQQDVETGVVREVTVRELHVERKVRLLYAKSRTLSHAARAFLDLVAAA